MQNTCFVAYNVFEYIGNDIAIKIHGLFNYTYFGGVYYMDNVRVVIWGFGAMGSGMARMLLKKKGVDIVGVCDMDRNKVGKSIFRSIRY